MCLDSIVANDYPKEMLEILVVDGMSDDRTPGILESYGRQFRFIKVLANPKKSIPCAVNTGVAHAKGDIIIRMDAHCTYERDYISQCVRHLREFPADNVGGRWVIVPRENTVIGKVIAVVLSHRFGVGGAEYRVRSRGSEAERPRWVDTAPWIGCRKDLFERIGGLNEKLARSEDIEFARRLRRQGGRILLVPSMVSYYYARSDFKVFWKHAFENGMWAILPLKYISAMPVSPRHLVPLAFVASLIGTAVLSVVSPVFLLLFLLGLGTYALVSLYFSGGVAIRERDLRYLALMPVVFGALHVAYGLGSMVGLVRVLVSKIAGRANMRDE
ncbi:glycosyltransferase family 2 protein [Acidobacteriia bacterium AH_259_A11_L15]|nr:glycosyltransferase family 2 protein [Acidobacteriia bacterium AH_259_A11_L15]